MDERDSIPEEQSAAAAGEPIETFKEAVQRIASAAMAAGCTSKSQLLPYIISQGYPPSHKWHYVLLANIVRVLGFGTAKSVSRGINVDGKQGESVRGDDVSIFIDELREKARKDPSWARIYWDAIKSRQSEDEIPQETRDKAAQVVAAAVDELTEGKPQCCKDSMMELVKRITGLAEKK